MGYIVNLSEAAEADLVEIYQYIRARDGSRRAEGVLKRLESAFHRLTTFPERGGYTKELAALGIREYREVRLKPYRLVYAIVREQVIIVLVADGRRDMQTTLEQRLLSG